ncbi:MAG: hypothetical protein KIC47_12370 [Clostridium sp.]|nr:hypothetical protein [Clostridium sp.]MBS5951091.1 hypothetical protein [Clostridium sp.]
MLNNIFKNKNKLIKIIHIILLITTGLYLLESIFLAGLFTNPILACINIILSIISLIIAIIKKERKLAIIDLSILLGTLAIFIYLINL